MKIAIYFISFLTTIIGSRLRLLKKRVNKGEIKIAI